MLKDELRAKVADLLAETGNPYSAKCVRAHRPADVRARPRVVAAAEAVIALLDDYDEVMVRPNMAYDGTLYVAGESPNYSNDRTCFAILRRKAPEPEPVSIAREDAALLMEFVKDAPRHSPELDAAVARLRKVTG